MNKKVFRVMLTLVAVFLLALYVLKIFFPEQFVMSISSEPIKQIGEFIDQRVWLRYICAGITSFITYWLYCCACSHRLYLKWYECLIILGFIVINRVVNCFDTTFGTALSLCSFVLLPSLLKCNLKECAIVYTFHVIAQSLSLAIRNLPIYLTTTNYATVLLLGLESYFWLLLFYILFNYKKKEENKE